MSNNTIAKNIRAQRERVNEAIQEGLGDAAEIKFLKESFAAVIRDILRFEDDMWSPVINGWSQEAKGFTLEESKQLSIYAEKRVKTDALLGKGLRAKTNHVFGRGYVIESSTGSIQPRYQKIIDDPDNQAAVFSVIAMMKNNRIKFNSGNLFIMYDEKEKKFHRLALDLNIQNYIAYDNDPERVKYYLRSYTVRNDLATGQEETKQEWVPVDTYKQSLKKGELKKTLPNPGVGTGSGRIEVNQNAVIIDQRINNDVGEVWGVPDCLSALPWSWASNEYLKDGSKLLKALSTLAYQVKARTEAAQKTAGAKISRAKVGGTAVTGIDTEISQIPRANAVDLYTGRPLFAQVATALDLSVTTLTGDTARGGSANAEGTLTLPEQLAALARQAQFEAFLKRCFIAMGAPDLRLNFARLTVDPTHRIAQTASLFRLGGAISQKEFRALALELLDITGDVNELPEPDAWTGSKFSTLEEWLRETEAEQELADQAAAAIAGDPNARQGNSGAVGSITDDNELRSTDAQAE